MSTNYLEGMPEESLSFHPPTNVSTWSLRHYWNSDWNRVLWPDEQVLTTNSQGGFDIKRRIVIQKELNLHG